MQNSLEKIRKGSGLLSGVLTAALALLAFFSAGYLYYLARTLLWPEDVFSLHLGESGLSIGNIHGGLRFGAWIDAKYLPELRLGTENVSARAVQILNLLLSLAAAAPLAGILLLLQRACSAAARGRTPFTHENARRLRAAAILLIADGLLVTDLYRAALAATALRGATAGLSVGHPNGALVAAGAALLLFVYVFDYGAALQLEYDQTL